MHYFILLSALVPSVLVAAQEWPPMPVDGGYPPYYPPAEYPTRTTNSWANIPTSSGFDIPSTFSTIPTNIDIPTPSSSVEPVEPSSSGSPSSSEDASEPSASEPPSEQSPSHVGTGTGVPTFTHPGTGTGHPTGTGTGTVSGTAVEAPEPTGTGGYPYFPHDAPKSLSNIPKPTARGSGDGQNSNPWWGKWGY